MYCVLKFNQSKQRYYLSLSPHFFILIFFWWSTVTSVYNSHNLFVCNCTSYLLVYYVFVSFFTYRLDFQWYQLCCSFTVAWKVKIVTICSCSAKLVQLFASPIKKNIYFIPLLFHCLLLFAVTAMLVFLLLSFKTDRLSFYSCMFALVLYHELLASFYVGSE